MFLPNGVHIYLTNPSLETFERIDGMIERGEPISITGRYNGVETTHVVWHPDDRVILLEGLMPKGYVPPPGRLTRWWREVVRSIITWRSN
jgi:hypothetical protein